MLDNSDGIFNSSGNAYGLTDSIQPQDAGLIVPLQANPSGSADIGVFTVGSTGRVSIDYLYDGGVDQGELAIFNLDGLDQLGVGSQAYIQAAASRALQNSSDSGYVVIRDRTEGAKFSGTTPSGGDFNSGSYLGVKNFNLQPGTSFGIMLVPNNTVESVRNNPDVNGSGRPLFSINAANLDQTTLFTQVPKLDISNQSTVSSGNIFSFEDREPELGSDLDYNDLVFQLGGATGGATSIDTVIKPEQNWLNTPVGQQIRSSTLQSGPVGTTTVGRTQISKALWRRSQL